MFYADLPFYDSQFITLFQSGNDNVRWHVAVDVEAVDYKDAAIVAMEKARLGMQVDIMPTLQEDDPLRAIIFPDAIGYKCLDLRINNAPWEVEKLFNSQKLNNLKHAIDGGSRQANHLIILLSHAVNYSFLYRVVKGRFKDHKHLSTVEFRYDATNFVFKKEKQ